LLVAGHIAKGGRHEQRRVVPSKSQIGRATRRGALEILRRTKRPTRKGQAFLFARGRPHFDRRTPRASADLSRASRKLRGRRVERALESLRRTKRPTRKGQAFLFARGRPYYDRRMQRAASSSPEQGTDRPCAASNGHPFFACSWQATKSFRVARL
jgi:hypothetical protein